MKVNLSVTQPRLIHDLRYGSHRMRCHNHVLAGISVDGHLLLGTGYEIPSREGI